MRSAADRSHTICILSVPATMTCHDLLTFTAACHQDMQHFRILRDGSPNQYMALITFRSSVSKLVVKISSKDDIQNLHGNFLLYFRMQQVSSMKLLMVLPTILWNQM